MNILNRSARLVAVALLSTGCAAKQLRADLDTVNAELATCKASLDRCEGTLAEQISAQALADKRLAAYKELAEQLRQALGIDDLDILLRNGRLVIQLPNKILFDTGATELKPEGKEVLTKVAKVMKRADRSFLIAGHTDNTPVKADATTYHSNWELSVLRATTAVAFLQQAGVPPTQLGAAGYGEHMPDATNDNEKGRKENRRLEIIVMPKLDEIPPMPANL